MPVSQIIKRGVVAAHGALLGALFLFLLQAPAQLLGTVGQVLGTQVTEKPGQTPGIQLITMVVVAFASLLCALAVFLLYPLVVGGTLGQVRDRIERPDQSPRRFGTYARAFYAPLLGNLAVFVLIGLIVVLPVMGIAIGLALQKSAEAMPAAADWQNNNPLPPIDAQQFTRQMLLEPAMLVVLGIASVILAAASMVYWIANTIVVSEQRGLAVAWREALHFCRRNVAAVLVVILLSLAIAVVVSPLGVILQLGIVADPWLLAALALVYAACLGYWGVLLSGVMMSLYLARRPTPSGGLESGLSAVA